ncbi:glycosyltransferase family 2 protein [Candidatus Saccharibacteria bacterium]|nr:glycosyltransferase family 2 protein [Candidatus Saccharibacteria bacterium]
MSKPILTIAIPAYNVAPYIGQTVSSLVSSKYQNHIEIIIVNDGSSDSTAEVIEKIAKKHSCVKIINKTNGGHGSSINAGLENATGKYFRLLDGDDWFDTNEFDQFIEKLLSENADLVLTDYAECFIKRHLTRPALYYYLLPEFKLINLDEIYFPEWGPTLPTTTIKTSLLKKFNLKVDEHCFYVDQEYNLACYLCAKTVKYYPFIVYQYRLEREGQSMERASLIRNVYSHEKVCARLLSEFKKHSATMPTAKKDYLSSRVIIPMCHMQYEIATDYCKSKKAFISFDKKLKPYKSFYNHPGIAGTITNFHRKTHALFMPFNSLVKKIAQYKERLSSKFPKKRPLLILALIIFLLLILLAILLEMFFHINPFITFLSCLSFLFLIVTSFHRISNYLIFSLLNSLILLIDHTYFPLVICLYAFSFLYMIAVNIIKFKFTKTMLKKDIKMIIKLSVAAIISTLTYFISTLLH